MTTTRKADASRQSPNPSSGTSQSTEVVIQGFPVFGDKRLLVDDPIFDRLASMQQFADFARQLRGPFAIVVRRAEIVTAITDFGACYPIYWIKNVASSRIEVGTSVGELAQYSTRILCTKALFWRASRGGVGPDPYYGDMNLLASGMVHQTSRGRQMSSLAYIDWKSVKIDGPATYAEARERFVEIATSYLAAVAGPSKRIACFLSGGADSAIVAHLAALAGCEVIGFTADYAVPGYSEMAGARHAAATLSIEHHAVKVGYVANRRGMWRMNTRSMDVPASHLQLTSLLALADAAIEQGCVGFLTGDNSGPIFLEFGSIFHGLPTAVEDLDMAVRGMTLAQYKKRQAKFGRCDDAAVELLRCFGLDRTGCEAWQGQYDYGTPETDALFEAVGYPLALQAEGQKWTGVVHQNCWLPAQLAAGHNSQILSPFLDIEMIRFAMSLPLHLKYRDGVGKWFLREFLKQETGLVPAKLASPNPSRLWWLPPRADDAARIDPRLRRLLLQWQGRNLMHCGREYTQLASITALGIWLAAHPLDQPNNGEH